MSRATNKLSARKVESLKEAGWHGDGAGLYLRIGEKRRAWVFVYQWNKKRRELGVGSAADVSLAQAREKAGQMRAAVLRGEDPGAPAKPAEEVVTFGAWAESRITEWEKGWKNPKHRQQWRNTIKTYCESLATMQIQDVGTKDILAILEPIWLTKNETADRLRGRIERLLSSAAAMGHRDVDQANPARWSRHLEHLLPHYDPGNRGHFTALPYTQIPAFMVRLRERKGTAARALEFTILTAVRTQMTLGMTRSEVKGGLWTIPKARMKKNRDHAVPFGPRAMSLVADGGKKIVFSAEDGGQLSDGAMERVLDRMGVAVTVHGMRSSFKDWAVNKTDFPDETSEEILSHVVGSKTRQAYRREVAMDKMRDLLLAWEAYCGSGAKEGRDST